MRRLTLRIALAAFGLALAGRGFAQNAPAPASPHPFLRHRLRECLAIVDLTDAEKASIQAILDAAAPTIQADADAVQAARQTLKTALEANPPDACAIGADALAEVGARDPARGASDGAAAGRGGAPARSGRASRGLPRRAVRFHDGCGGHADADLGGVTLRF
jgi:lambda repressor-like predicted transcriptional regulator